MIIIKDKGKNSKIYVSRYDSSLNQSNINNGGSVDESYITEGELDNTLEDYLKKNGVKTINGESIVGEGNITIDLTDYYTKDEVDDKISTIDFPKPDWNAQVGEAGYIENRTHYVITKDISVQLVAIIDERYGYYDEPALKIDNFIFDYELVFNDGWSYADIDFHKLGNYDISFNDEYFGHLYVSDGMYNDGIAITGDFVTAYENGEIDFISSIKMQKIEQLDEKYIPDTIARKSDVYEEIDNLWDEATALWENVESIEQSLDSKQDEINDLDTIRSGAAKGATAIQSVKTINGQSMVGEGNIIIEGGSGGGNANIVDLTQDEYDAITPDEDTLYVITDAPSVDLSTKQDTLVSGNNIKTINGVSILGSGNITIEGGTSNVDIPIYYLYKSKSAYDSPIALNANKEVRAKILANWTTEESPIIIVKDYYNDTLCNNVYANNNYVEIQCANSRVGGKTSDLIDERYELTSAGWLREIKVETVASRNWVNEQIGDIETILDNIIGE